MKNLTILAFIFLSLKLVAQIPTNGLIAKYDFDDRLSTVSLSDDVGTNNLTVKAVFVGSNATLATDRFGQTNAIKTIGTIYEADDFTPSGPNTPNPRGMSFSFWVNGSTIANNTGQTNHIIQEDIVNSDGTIKLGSYSINIRNGAIYMEAEYAVSTAVATSPYYIANNGWQHIVASYYSFSNNTGGAAHTGTLYVNGNPVDSFNTGHIRNFTNEIYPYGHSKINYFGGSTFTSDTSPSGEFDDFLIYSRALTDTEVYDLTTVGATGNTNEYCPSVNTNRFRFTSTSGITNTTVDISVVGTTPVDIAWVETGVGFIIPSQTVTSYTQGSTYTITGLKSGTEYTILAKSSCNSGAYTSLGTVTTTGTSLNTDSFSSTSFSVYPNPVQNTLTIQLEDTLKKAEIYTLLGKKVLESTSKEINTSNLAQGMYVLKVATDGKTAIQKIIKQ